MKFKRIILIIAGILVGLKTTTASGFEKLSPSRYLNKVLLVKLPFSKNIPWVFLGDIEFFSIPQKLSNLEKNPWNVAETNIHTDPLFFS